MKRVLLLICVAGALVLAASASASPSRSSMRGVVVATQHGVLLVASSGGAVRALPGAASVGSVVRISGGRVVGSLGHAHRAVIRGVVVKRSGRLTFLSVARHLLVVHGAVRRVASASDSAPLPGAVVQQTVGIDDQGELDDLGEQLLGQSGPVQVQATVSAVGTGTVTLTVNGQTLVVPLPVGLTLPSSLVSTQVTLNLSFANGQATVDDQGDDNQGDQQGGGSGDDNGGGD